MTLTVADLARQAGTSRQALEGLAADLPTGAGRLYVSYISRKKHGGVRDIVHPKSPFDAVSKNLSRSLSRTSSYGAPDHVHGFVHGRSTVSNALPHLNKECVLRVDLEDFFATVTAPMVREALRAIDYGEEAAHLAVGLMTIGGKLPIGLSTSPFLSNVVFRKTDAALSDYARSEGLSFTRYADDLNFSGVVEDRHFEAIQQLLDADGWSVNTRKTAFMRRGGRQYVTGLYVGGADMPRIPRETKRRMRWILHIISKFGYENYWSEFGGETDGMTRNRLLGWACYIAAVEPDVGFPLLKTFDEVIPMSRHDDDWMQ